MKWIKTGSLQDGSECAIDVIDLKGNPLVNKGSTVSGAAIEKLKYAAIPFIYVKDADTIVSNVYPMKIIAEMLRVLYYFSASGGENAEILKRYNSDEVRRFLSYSNDAGSRIAYGHIFSFFAGEMLSALKKGEKQCYDFRDYRDKSTYYSFHAVNAACISAVMAYNMGLPDKDITDLITGTLLYDIKMIIHKFVNDSRELVEIEKNEMRQHPAEGYEAIRRIFGLSASAAAIALQHHERIDGSGYPKGLKGGDINLLSRIAAIADVYDALTSNRPFRPAYKPDEAWDYMVSNSGVLFDEQVMEAFKQSIPKYMPGDSVELSDGRSAVVLKNSPGKFNKPGINIIEKNGKSAIISCGEKTVFSIIKTLDSVR